MGVKPTKLLFVIAFWILLVSLNVIPTGIHAQAQVVVKGNQAAPLRGVYEVVLNSKLLSARPFQAESVQVTFTQPDGTDVTVDAFYDGGSDHMVKWDADASVNPYNPFLAMWTVVTRTTERNQVIMPSEAISREEALRMYTINNAYASFEESIKGSIEPGKLADVAILSIDLLDCPLNQMKDIHSELTIVGGKIVH